MSNLFMNSFHYAPVQEDISRIIELSNPQGKSVLTVSAYGYALPFIAAGAKNVTSFDISPDQTAWNHFVRSMIMNTSFEYNQEFFYYPFFKQKEKKRIDIPWKILLADIPGEYKSTTIQLAQEYLFDSKEIEQVDDIREIYPHLIEEIFENMQEGIKNWRIIEGEFIDVLKQQQEKFDIINGSTIRSWVHRKYSNIRSFGKEYNLPLLQLVHQRLNPRGIFLDTEIDNFIFPEYPAGIIKKFSRNSYPSHTLAIHLLTKN
jgi:hypothetical protein